MRDGRTVYNGNPNIKTQTVIGQTDSGSLLATNIPITTKVVGAYCSSASTIVVIPIRMDNNWRFFIGQFAQIGGGYGLGGKTQYQLTIEVQYQE